MKPGYCMAIAVWALLHLAPLSWAGEIDEQYVVNILHGKDATIPSQKVDQGNTPLLSLSIRFNPDNGELVPESYIKLVPIGNMLKSQAMSGKQWLLVCCTGLEPALHKEFARKLLDNIQRFLTMQVAVPADRVRTMTMVERPLSLPPSRLLTSATAARVEVFTLE